MKKKIVYVCGVDFQHELGPDGGRDPIYVYNSVTDLKRHKTCWKECGIVAVELVERRWVAEQKLPFGRNKIAEVLGRAPRSKRRIRRSGL